MSVRKATHSFPCPVGPQDERQGREELDHFGFIWTEAPDALDLHLLNRRHGAATSAAGETRGAYQRRGRAG